MFTDMESNTGICHDLLFFRYCNNETYHEACLPETSLDCYPSFTGVWERVTEDGFMGENPRIYFIEELTK